MNSLNIRRPKSNEMRIRNLLHSVIPSNNERIDRRKMIHSYSVNPKVKHRFQSSYQALRIFNYLVQSFLEHHLSYSVLIAQKKLT